MNPSLPRYAAVTSQLKAAIQAGELSGQIPPETELAERYHVSRMTLRRAIAVLVEEGLLDVRHGEGTFIRNGAFGNRVITLLVAPDLVNHHNNLYHQQVVTSLIYNCSARGWLLRVSPSIEDLLARLSAGRGISISACIAVAFGSKDHHLLEKIPLPIIGIDGDHWANSWSILPDNQKGTEDALSRLIQLGHRQIAHICGSQEKLAGRERKDAFIAAMQKHALPLNDGFIVPGNFLLRDGYEAMSQLWKKASRPTAVYCASDMVAVGAARWAAENGIRIGRDVSLIGCDGLAISGLFWPSIATLAIDFGSHASAALDVIAHGGPHEIKRTPMKLIERDSLHALGSPAI